MPELEIPGTDQSPRLQFHVNPSYALYQWLRTEAAKPAPADDGPLENAIRLMRRSVNVRGVHGVWDVWEGALASAQDRAPFEVLRQAIVTTGKDLARALQEAEPYFHGEVWPDRQAAIRTALGTIEETLAPRFPVMAARHSTLLDLAWPDTIDVYLVTDCYDFGGAYSHPLTVDVVRNTGLRLCETVLHEATHVADVHTAETGSTTLGDRLISMLVARGLDRRTAFNLWHAVIFAASGARIREALDSYYVDYAVDYNLYQWFKAPNAPKHWHSYETHGDETALMASLLQDAGA